MKTEVEQLRERVTQLTKTLGNAAREIERLAGGAPSYRHQGTGRVYALVGPALVQTSSPLGDYANVYVYRGEDGKLWVRPQDEFAERFEAIG